MIGVVIVSQGALGQEFLAAAEHVVGVQSGVCAVCLDWNSEVGECGKHIHQAVVDVDSGGVAFETVYAQNGIGQKRLMSGWRQGSTHHGRNGLSAVAGQVCFPRFF